MEPEDDVPAGSVSEDRDKASGRLAAVVSRTGGGVREAGKDERGFTLVELLVVVIVLGILAAIAIPAFLSQRQSAEDAGAISHVRNAATAQAAYFAENGEYTRFRSELREQGLTLNTEDYEPEEYAYNDTGASGGRVTHGPGFCVAAKHRSGERWYRITDESGNIEEDRCPGEEPVPE